MDINSPPPEQFKDRKVALVVFGILTILGGCFCILFFLLILVAPMLAAHSPNPPAVAPSRLPALIYGVMAVAFVWLGIGSIMARRWARALLAILSWSFVVMGVAGLVFLAVLWPHLKEVMAAVHPPDRPPLPDSMQTAMIAGMLAFVGILIVGPLIWALFYSGRNVKATCEALDPAPRWTDRCPLPVLAISLWLIVGAISMIGVLILAPVAPFFGSLVSGTPARIYYLCLTIIWIWASWRLYRLDRVAWWVVLIVVIACAVSAWLTYSRHDLTEVYSLMGYSAERIASIQKFGFTKSLTSWSKVFWTLPLVVYLFYIRKFFKAPTADTTSLSQ